MKHLFAPDTALFSLVDTPHLFIDTDVLTGACRKVKDSLQQVSSASMILLKIIEV